MENTKRTAAKELIDKWQEDQDFRHVHEELDEVFAQKRQLIEARIGANPSQSKQTKSTDLVRRCFLK